MTLPLRASLGSAIATAVAAGVLLSAAAHPVTPPAGAAMAATREAVRDSAPPPLAPPPSTGPRRAPAPAASGPRSAGRAPDASGPRTSGPRAGIGHAVQADAYGVNLDPLSICLGCTTAQAGPNSSGAEGRELRLAGEPVSEGQSPANGYRSGSLVTVPANPLLSLAIAGWDGVTRADRSSSEAHARGAVADLAVGDGRPATLSLGDSHSDAAYAAGSNGWSRASGESNGAQARAWDGRIVIVVLHSEGSSEHRGRAYLASAGGSEVLPSSQAGADNGMEVPPLVGVALLHGDAAGALIGSASDGRSQRVAGVGSTWVGHPAEDPQPLR